MILESLIINKLICQISHVLYTQTVQPAVGGKWRSIDVPHMASSIACLLLFQCRVIEHIHKHSTHGDWLGYQCFILQKYLPSLGTDNDHDGQTRSKWGVFQTKYCNVNTFIYIRTSSDRVSVICAWSVFALWCMI